jgi:hypothetical protein
MAIALKTFNPSDREVAQLQQNTFDAVAALSAQKGPPVGVVSISGNTKLVGNEDVVLVDASTATVSISLILPGAKQLQRAMIVKVTKAGQQQVTIKAVDIPSTTAPSINGVAAVAIPAGSTGHVQIVSDGRNFWTVS